MKYPIVPLVVFPLLLGMIRIASALPPGEHGRGFREGANHHVGDEGFVAAEGRAPTSLDDEHVRMRDHLVHVRGLLGAREATSPARAKRRQELLSYLDEYIAKGTTPRNVHLPWRNPVFIDDAGTICAVGYLIERSVGRPVAESIAKAHRYDYLEDIAAAMPEVRTWIEDSGFTLEELASIQPGYVMPEIEKLEPEDVTEQPDGPYEQTALDAKTHGTIAHGRMEGSWTRTNDDGKVIGSGTFTHGAGEWRSAYPDGALLAEGSYRKNLPTGTWRFYHHDGRLAATGRFQGGHRHGRWRFYQDDEKHTPVAVGSFVHGMTVGTWRHFDTQGHLLAVSRDQTPAQWPDWNLRPAGHLLSVVPEHDGLTHFIHEGNVSGDWHRLDLISLRDTRIYVLSGEYVYDAEGHRLAKDDAGTWRSTDCRWSNTRKNAARAGDLVTLHGLIYGDFPEEHPCGTSSRPIADERARAIEHLLSRVRDVRSESSDMVKQIVLGDETIAELAAEEDSPKDLIKSRTRVPDDMVKVLASNMTWFVEFPHVDRRFLQVFSSLPGYP